MIHKITFIGLLWEAYSAKDEYVGRGYIGRGSVGIFHHPSHVSSQDLITAVTNHLNLLALNGPAR